MASLLVPLAACTEEMEESYSTWADAQRVGAIERGWVPAFVPKSARNIRDIHNLDTNAQILEFTAPRSDVPVMVRGLRAIPAEDMMAAAKLSKELGLKSVSQGVEAYVVCAEPLDGVLLVDRQSGRTVYKTPVDWAENNCSSAA
ncbi:MAG: hypothetical protein ACR2KH_01520 [Sphingomicrobium sp.]